MLTQDYQVLCEFGGEVQAKGERSQGLSDQQSRHGKTCQLIPQFLSQLDPTLGLG